VSYAQFQEDLAVLKYFGAHKGRFLDLGAFDGKTRSNTLLLAERGWTGVAVDASWEVVPKALESYKGLGVTFVSAAVGANPGLVPFFDCGNANLSTASIDLVHRTPDLRKIVKQRFVACVTVRDLLKVFPGTFDFLSVDLEGWTLPVLETVPLDEIKCRMVCAEYFHPMYAGFDEKTKLTSYMVSRGFSVQGENPSNMLFVR
jgi:FkbM family methyltransferase